MIGSNVLIFPDSGPGFARAARTAALYADGIHALTIPNFDAATDLINALVRRAKAAPNLNYAAARIIQYANFARDNGADLRLLQAEGLLSAPSSSLMALPGTFMVASVRVAGEIISGWIGDRSAVELLFNATRDLPPSFMDLAPLALVLPEVALPVPAPLVDTNTIQAFETILRDNMLEWRIATTMIYLLVVNVVSETTGIATLSWSKTFRDALASVRGPYLEKCAIPQEYLALRRTSQSNLAQCILRQHLPRVDDLPLEEILEVRRKHRGELKAFRLGVDELAAQVDLTATPQKMRLQIADLVFSRVSPAIRDLESSIQATRIEALKKMGKFWESLPKMAAATTPLLVSHTFGAPLDVQVAVGALGGLLAAVGEPLFEAKQERKKLLNASQWSLMLRLSKMGA